MGKPVIFLYQYNYFTGQRSLPHTDCIHPDDYPADKDREWMIKTAHQMAESIRSKGYIVEAYVCNPDETHTSLEYEATFLSEA